jgi:hypothetical protein
MRTAGRMRREGRIKRGNRMKGRAGKWGGQDEKVRKTRRDLKLEEQNGTL